MLGIGNIFGSLTGGFLDSLGLGKITQFVKMGLNALLTGNLIGVARDVFDLVSNFRSNFLDRAAKQPPLGNFQTPSTAASPLSSKRMGEFLNLFERLSGGFNSKDGLRKIYNALNIIKDMFDNYRRFDNRATRSVFRNLKI